MRWHATSLQFNARLLKETLGRASLCLFTLTEERAALKRFWIASRFRGQFDQLVRIVLDRSRVFPHYRLIRDRAAKNEAKQFVEPTNQVLSDNKPTRAGHYSLDSAY